MENFLQYESISKNDSCSYTFSSSMKISDGMRKMRSMCERIGAPHSSRQNYDNSSNPQTDIWASPII